MRIEDSTGKRGKLGRFLCVRATHLLSTRKFYVPLIFVILSSSLFFFRTPHDDRDDRRLGILPNSEVINFEGSQWSEMKRKCGDRMYELSGGAVLGHVGLLARPIASERSEAHAAGCETLGYHATWFANAKSGPELLTLYDEGDTARQINEHLAENQAIYGNAKFSEMARVYEEVWREGVLNGEYIAFVNDCATLMEDVTAKLGFVDENDEKARFLALRVMKTSPFGGIAPRVVINGSTYWAQISFFIGWFLGTNQSDEEVADIMMQMRIEGRKKRAKMLRGAAP